jgi:hypothetical protein
LSGTAEGGLSVFYYADLLREFIPKVKNYKAAPVSAFFVNIYGLLNKKVNTLA